MLSLDQLFPEYTRKIHENDIALQHCHKIVFKHSAEIHYKESPNTNHLKDDMVLLFTTGAEHNPLIWCYKVHCLQDVCQRNRPRTQPSIFFSLHKIKKIKSTVLLKKISWYTENKSAERLTIHNPLTPNHFEIN